MFFFWHDLQSKCEGLSKLEEEEEEDWMWVSERKETYLICTNIQQSKMREFLLTNGCSINDEMKRKNRVNKTITHLSFNVKREHEMKKKKKKSHLHIGTNFSMPIWTLNNKIEFLESIDRMSIVH